MPSPHPSAWPQPLKAAISHFGAFPARFGRLANLAIVMLGLSAVVHAAPASGTLAGPQPYGCFALSGSQSRHVAKVCLQRLDLKWHIDTLLGEPVASFSARWVVQPQLFLREGPSQGEPLAGQPEVVRRAFEGLGLSKLALAAQVGGGRSVPGAAIAIDPGSMRGSDEGLSLSSPTSGAWGGLFSLLPHGGNPCEAERALPAEEARAIVRAGVRLSAARVCAIEFSGLADLDAVIDVERSPRSEAASALRGALTGSRASTRGAEPDRSAGEASGTNPLAAALGQQSPSAAPGAGGLGAAMAEAGRKEDQRRQELSALEPRLQSVGGALGSRCTCYLQGRSCGFDTDLARAAGGGGTIDKIFQGCRNWNTSKAAASATLSRSRHNYVSPREAADVTVQLRGFEQTLSLIDQAEGQLTRLALAESDRRSEEKEAESRRQEAEERESERRATQRRRQQESDDREEEASRRRHAEGLRRDTQQSIDDLNEFIKRQNQQRADTFELGRRAQREQDDKRQAHESRREADRQRAENRQRDFDRQRERDQQAERDRQRERDRRAAADRDRLAQLDQRKANDQRQAQARRDEQQRSAGGEADYLRRIASGARLQARTCYGEQHVTGSLPRIEPRAVACVDVHFRATCPGSSAVHRGMLKNMQGMGTGCFGDTVQIAPALACRVEEIRVDVSEARRCEF